MDKTVRLAAGSIVVGLTVLALKYAAYLLTGSVALYSDALESIVNVATAVTIFLAVRFSAVPPDASHPFGHQKVEYLSAVLIGVLIRSVGGIPGALLGTLILGLAITVGNVVSPVLIGRDFRGRTATVTGSYTAALNVGSMLTLSATGPLVSVFGWQVALAVWAVLPLLAAVVWIPLARRAAAQAARPECKSQQDVKERHVVSTC